MCARRLPSLLGGRPPHAGNKYQLHGGKALSHIHKVKLPTIWVNSNLRGQILPLNLRRARILPSAWAQRGASGHAPAVVVIAVCRRSARRSSFG